MATPVLFQSKFLRQKQAPTPTPTPTTTEMSEGEKQQLLNEIYAQRGAEQLQKLSEQIAYWQKRGAELRSMGGQATSESSRESYNRQAIFAEEMVTNLSGVKNLASTGRYDYSSLTNYASSLASGTAERTEIRRANEQDLLQKNISAFQREGLKPIVKKGQIVGYEDPYEQMTKIFEVPKGSEVRFSRTQTSPTISEQKFTDLFGNVITKEQKELAPQKDWIQFGIDQIKPSYGAIFVKPQEAEKYKDYAISSRFVPVKGERAEEAIKAYPLIPQSTIIPGLIDTKEEFIFNAASIQRAMGVPREEAVKFAQERYESLPEGKKFLMGTSSEFIGASKFGIGVAEFGATIGLSSTTQTFRGEEDFSILGRQVSFGGVAEKIKSKPSMPTSVEFSTDPKTWLKEKATSPQLRTELALTGGLLAGLGGSYISRAKSVGIKEATGEFLSPLALIKPKPGVYFSDISKQPETQFRSFKVEKDGTIGRSLRGFGEKDEFVFYSEQYLKKLGGGKMEAGPISTTTIRPAIMIRESGAIDTQALGISRTKGLTAGAGLDTGRVVSMKDFLKVSQEFGRGTLSEALVQQKWSAIIGEKETLGALYKGKTFKLTKSGGVSTEIAPGIDVFLGGRRKPGYKRVITRTGFVWEPSGKYKIKPKMKGIEYDLNKLFSQEGSSIFVRAKSTKKTPLLKSLTSQLSTIEPTLGLKPPKITGRVTKTPLLRTQVAGTSQQLRQELGTRLAGRQKLNTLLLPRTRQKTIISPSLGSRNLSGTKGRERMGVLPKLKDLTGLKSLLRGTGTPPGAGYPPTFERPIFKKPKTRPPLFVPFRLPKARRKKDEFGLKLPKQPLAYQPSIPFTLEWAGIKPRKEKPPKDFLATGLSLRPFYLGKKKKKLKIFVGGLPANFKF